MRAVKHSNLTEQNYCYSTTFALTDFSTRLDEQCFNLSPMDVAAYRAGENSLQGFLVLPLHAELIPQNSTISMRLGDGAGLVNPAG